MRLLLTTAAGLCLLSAGAIAQTSTPPAPNQMLAQPGISAGSSSRSSATPSNSATQGLTEGRQSSNDGQNRSTLAENNNDNGYGDDNDSKGNGGNWGGRGWRNDEGNWGGMGPGMRGDHMGWRDHGRWHHGRMGWGGEDRDGAMRGGMKGHGAFFAFRSKEGGFMVRCAGDESTHSCVQAIMPLLNRVETMHNGQSGGGSSNNNGGANKSTGGDNPSNQ